MIKKLRDITDDRVIIKAVKNACLEHGIHCTMFSDGWVIRLQKAQQIHFIYGYGFDYNSQIASAIATDKVATHQLLKNQGISTVPHYLLTSIANNKVSVAYLKKLLKLHGDLVIKPLKGSSGELIERFSDVSSIVNFIQSEDRVSWTASPFIDIDFETRLIVLDGSILLAYEKHDPKIIGNLKMFNLCQGAHPVTIEIQSLSEDIKDLARKTMQAIELRLGAVDIIFDRSGKMYVIEVNSGTSLEHYARVSSDNHDRAFQLYEFLTSASFKIPL